MTEFTLPTVNADPRSALEAQTRANLEVVLAQQAAYDPEASAGIPSISGVDHTIHEIVAGPEALPLDILTKYAGALKFEEDALAQYAHREPNYSNKLEIALKLDAANLRTLYGDEGAANPLRAMLVNQVSRNMGTAAFMYDAVDIVKKIYDAETIPSLLHINPEDPTLLAVRHALRSGQGSIHHLYTADVRHRFEDSPEKRRRWMRDAIRLATDITDPEQADAYVYSTSRSIVGEYSLEAMVARINTYGSAKLQAIKEFAGITSLGSYSDKQLDIIYKLSQGDQAEVERLQKHDVSIGFLNLDGDHNGISHEVAERIDDDAGRTLFFEISKPQQIYTYMKRLSDLGIAPSTLIFASHGSAGQFFISERPAIDSETAKPHVTVIIDQALADHITKTDPSVSGYQVYDISNANGLIRSIQRFMQPSRAIDDPDKDLGRKKVISLSCQFDGEAGRASLGPNGETVKGKRTTLLRRFGEVIMNKLDDEHIDIYGADISTNKQTKTPKGFHYNQVRDGAYHLYPATVLHIDGQTSHLERQDEVELHRV